MHAHGPLRVILVEDDIIDRKATRRAIKSASVEMFVVEVDSIKAGLQALRTERFHCAIVDWQLPDGTAPMFLARSRDIAPGLPIIVMTGGGDDARTEQALGQGAQDFLIKGRFDSDTLVRAIQYAVSRKQADELRVKLARNERSNSIGQLAAGVAHEVNNPSAWIASNLQFLQQGLERLDVDSGLGSDGRRELRDMLELVAECRQGITRISEIVKALRSYAEASRVSDESVDLVSVAEHAIGLTQDRLRRVARVETLFESRGRLVRGDASALVQMLVHILTNACQELEAHPPERARVIVDISVELDGIVLGVEDTGRGVSQELRRDVFNPFFSTFGERRAGMGLAVVADVVAQHHGSVSFTEPRQLSGARIEVRLPIDREMLADTGERAIPKPDIDRVLHILVINDDQHLRTLFEQLLGDQHELEMCSDFDAGARSLSRLRGVDGVLVNLKHLATYVPRLRRELERAHIDSRRVVVCYNEPIAGETSDFLASAGVRGLRKPFGFQDVQDVLRHWASRGHPGR